MKTVFSAICATLLVLSASIAGAATISFSVFVDTSSLLSLPASASAPFALDFQLNGGNPLGNSATISGFNFGGGSATSNPAAARFGTASGDLFSTVTLTSSVASASNEFFQGFTPGAFLRFNVLLTTNVNGPTPDAFSFAILDSGLLNIPTSGLGDSLLLVSVDSSTPALRTFTGTGAFDDVTVAAIPTPEPMSLVLVGAGLFGVGARRWRSRSART